MAEKEKLSKVEKALQNAVIKEIMADFGLEGVTKKRLGRYHREQRELGYADDRVPAEAGADCRDIRGEASLKRAKMSIDPRIARTASVKVGAVRGFLVICWVDEHDGNAQVYIQHVVNF